MNADIFDGVFDNRRSDQREIWQDGMLRRYCHRNALNIHSVWNVMRKPWGSYPDLPANASKVAA
ncbi:hypothetical protein [Dyella caseinilytica]|uniref:Uncharacterized protein n=1 Tax=Dyella caseinilytica TaxID=1849581 RepID=A0ABX7GZ28_9GAMM|nr:hypothetical protein [Dyella caseinilytica]QRN55216.1 hypothetical protein ISN74_07770 [Dyella caseinilytica]GGA00169.1 hypothetical protein GCM10011408_21290 [Dyella caseinilytica]